MKDTLYNKTTETNQSKITVTVLDLGTTLTSAHCKNVEQRQSRQFGQLTDVSQNDKSFMYPCYMWQYCFLFY